MNTQISDLETNLAVNFDHSVFSFTSIVHLKFTPLQSWLNRPRVRKLIQRNQLIISKQFKKVFKIIPDLKNETNQRKFMSKNYNQASNDEIFKVFFKLIKIIINKNK